METNSATVPEKTNSVETKPESKTASANSQSNNNDNSNSNNNNGDSGSRSKSGSNSNNRSGGRRDRSRRRSRSPVRSNNREDNRSKVSRRVYVANIPFDVRWGELKDLFREKVGNVRFCQLFENEEGKPRGCGIVEFEDSDSAQKAIEVVNRFNFKGRDLVVKEDLDIERDRFGRLIVSRGRDDDYRRGGGSSGGGGGGGSRSSGGDFHRGGSGGGSGHHDHRHHHDYPPPRDRYDDPYSNGSDSGANQGPYNTYGLSPQFLNSLGIKGPLNNRIFVANLDYKVSERKLQDVFEMAGKVTKTRLYCDHDGKSKGFGVVEFDHPIEAVQAISMFNNQKLYDRILSVRLDKFDNEDPFGNDGLPSKLPSGLESIGKGLGIGGQPLNIKSSIINNPPQPIASVPIVPQSAGVITAPIAPASQTPTAAASGPVIPQAAQALSVLSNLAGLQNLQSLAQLTNPVAQATLPASVQPNTGTYSTTNDMSTPSAVSVNSNYGGYSSVMPPLGSGSNQPTSYQTGQLMPTSNNYGHPAPQPQQQPPPQLSIPTNVASSGTMSAYSNSNTGTSGMAPISSYSTYDQRDYRDDQYRSHGIDTIFVRNLPPNFSWQNLRDRFHEVGEVRFAEMKGHGTALVRFGSDRDAQRAVDLMNGIRIENRAIEVSLYY